MNQYADEKVEVHLLHGEVLTGILDGHDEDRLYLTDIGKGKSRPGTTAVVLLSAVAWWRHPE